MNSNFKTPMGNFVYILGSESTGSFVQYGTLKLGIKNTRDCIQVTLEKHMHLRHLEVDERIEVLYAADMGLKEFSAVGHMGDYDYAVDVNCSRGKLHLNSMVQGVKQSFKKTYKGLLMENNTFFIFIPELLVQNKFNQIEVLLPNHGELLTTWFKSDIGHEKIDLLGEERVGHRVAIGATQYPDLSQTLIYDDGLNYLLCSVNGTDLMRLDKVELGL